MRGYGGLVSENFHKNVNFLLQREQIGKEGGGGLCATNWKRKRREGCVQQMSRKTRKLQFPHSSLLLEKIPQEREKYLRK